MRSVMVRAGLRLHLGFYRFNDPPFEYGGLGLAIEEPSLSITLAEEGKSELSGWVADIALRVLREVGIGGNVHVNVEGFLSRHVGLGTTTRLILSLLKAAYLMKGEAVDLPTMAWRLGRGRVSGVGVWTFIYGGMVVDSGRTQGIERVPPPVSHTYLPSTWRAVVALPVIEGYSVSEASEEPVMRKPNKHPKQDVLYSAVTRLLSAAHLGLFNEFVMSIEKIQELTGEYFSRWQGGIYCCEQSRVLAERMRELGLHGVGQSSWGPTVYGFASTDKVAKNVTTGLIGFMEEVGIRGYVWMTRIARNGHIAKVLSR